MVETTKDKILLKYVKVKKQRKLINKIIKHLFKSNPIVLLIFYNLSRIEVL